MPTFDANTLPSSTGFDLGSSAQRWDLFAQLINATGPLVFNGLSSIATIRFVDSSGDFTTPQAAHDDLPDNGGLIILPEGTTALNTTVTVTKHNVWFLGRGQGGFEAANSGGTKLDWTGGAAPMFRWGNQSDHIVGGGILSCELDGNALASHGIQVTDAQHANFKNLFIDSVITEGLTFDNNLASSDPNGFHDVDNVHIYLRRGTTQTASGVGLRGTTATNLNGITFTNLRVDHANGNGINIINGDGYTFIHPKLFRSAAETGLGININPALNTDPIGGMFINPAVGLGGVTVAADPGGSQISFFGFVENVDSGGVSGSFQNSVFVWHRNGIYEGPSLTLDSDTDNDFSLILNSGSTTAQDIFITLQDQGVAQWSFQKPTDNTLIIREAIAGATRLRFTAAGNTDFLASTSSGDHFDFRSSANAVRLRIHGDADRISFGSAVDTNLYRSAADTLKTDDAFTHRDVVTLDDTGTPSVAGANVFATGGTTAITAFDDGVNGQVVYIISAHSVVITDGAALNLAGGINYSITADDTLTLVFNGTNWYEIARSVN